MKMGNGLLVLFLVVIASCKRQVLPDQAIGKGYFPVNEGHYIEYEVDSTVYNTFTHDTQFVHLEFRDEIGSQFEDNQGRTSYVIQRSVRADSVSAWQDAINYYVTVNNFTIEVVENNLRFIKLALPVEANTSWNGNVYIPVYTSGLDEYKWYNGWEYTYTHINEEFNTGLVTYPNTAMIAWQNLTNDSTSTSQYNDFTNYKEVYSRNVGLVYRELTHWEFQPTEGFRNGFSVVFRAKKNN